CPSNLALLIFQHRRLLFLGPWEDAILMCKCGIRAVILSLLVPRAWASLRYWPHYCRGLRLKTGMKHALCLSMNAAATSVLSVRKCSPRIAQRRRRQRKRYATARARFSHACRGQRLLLNN